MHDTLGGASAYEPEFDEFEYRDGSAFESGFGDAQEIELAAELLEITDEAELDRFIGRVLRAASHTAGPWTRSATARELGGLLKGAAKKALPQLGRAIDPRLGDLGARVAGQAGRMFGLELEGLSPEDSEFEVARRFVRFAGSAARRAARPSAASPRRAARNATVAAAHRHAPGLLRKFAGRVTASSFPEQGRWVQRGHTIVIEDI
jgi:hypothetical protein